MLIQTREQFEHARTVLLDAPIIAVDTETTWNQYTHNTKLLGFSTHSEICGRDGLRISFYFPFAHNHDTSLFRTRNLPNSWLRDIKPALERKDVTLLFHNYKYDAQVFHRSGIVLQAPFYDTMLLSHMIDENTSHRLKILAKDYGLDPDPGKERRLLGSLMNDLGGWEKVPPDVMGVYAEKDARLTYELWEKLMPKLREQKLEHLWETEMDFCRVLTAMELKGIRIDRDTARSLAFQAEFRMKEIEAELGFDCMKPDILAQKLFEPHPKGLGFVVGARSEKKSKQFPQGRPVMDEKALLNYKHPVVDLVLEYRGLLKANSTWYKGFYNACDTTGRLHPNYKQHGTKTTRLSCSDPNMQQLPRNVDESPVRKLLRASDECSLHGFDYSQIELRLAAIYGRERSMIETFRQGGDIHQLTADQVGVSRHMGKTLNFAMIYGAGANKLADLLNIPPSESARIRAAFMASFPGIARAAERAYKAAQARGYIRLWTGRRRHFQWPSEYHKAFNSAVQGGAAEIMKRSMCLLHNHSKFNPPACIVGQVHDELWAELPDDNTDFYLELIKQVMTDWTKEQFGLEFPVDHKCLYGKDRSLVK